MKHICKYPELEATRVLMRNDIIEFITGTKDHPVKGLDVDQISIDCNNLVTWRVVIPTPTSFYEIFVTEDDYLVKIDGKFEAVAAEDFEAMYSSKVNTTECDKPLNLENIFEGDFYPKESTPSFPPKPSALEALLLAEEDNAILQNRIDKLEKYNKKLQERNSYLELIAKGVTSLYAQKLEEDLKNALVKNPPLLNDLFTSTCTTSVGPASFTIKIK